MCYMPDNMPITYQLACQMLDCVMPHQHKRCEIGIELMLKDNHFVLEQTSSACPYTNTSPLKPKSSGPHKPLRQDSSRAPCLLNDMLDELIRHQNELRIELARLCEELEAASVSCCLSPKLGACIIVQEQLCKTVLIRELPKGSSLSDKLSNEAVRPSQAFIHSSLPQVVPQGRNGP